MIKNLYLEKDYKVRPNDSQYPYFSKITYAGVGSFVAAVCSQPAFLAERCLVLGTPLPATFRGYFKGVGFVASAFVPTYMVITAGKEGSKHFFGPEYESIGAGLGSATTSLFMNPLELLATSSQTERFKQSGKSMREINSTLLREHSTHILFRGILPVTVRNGFAVYGMVDRKPYIDRKIQQHFIANRNISQILAWALVAGVFVPVTQFLSNVATLMHRDVSMTEPKQWMKAREALAQVYKNPKLWFKGTSPRFLKMWSIFAFGGAAAEQLPNLIKRLKR